MANIKSNEKSLRQDKKVHKNNHSQLAKMRTVVKKSNQDVNDESVSKAYKTADTTARKGIIHKNKANRIKSRIAKKNNAIKNGTATQTKTSTTKKPVAKKTTTKKTGTAAKKTTTTKKSTSVKKTTKK